MKVRKLVAATLATSFAMFYLPLSQACDKGAKSDFDHIVSIVKDASGKNADTEYYNFTTGGCEHVILQGSESTVSSYIPKDETSLGMYNIYRANGESQAESVKHVYRFLADNN